MNGTNGTEQVETVVVGAGQAGLATGYHLAKQNRSFVILESNARIGDNWRCHWDSLRLYSPAFTSPLPGLRFPAERMAFPTKDEMADFLEDYATAFDLPVRTGVRVTRVAAERGGYVVTTDNGSLRCDNVVVASGTFGRTPCVPDFAGDLDPDIVQLHSSAYKNPGQLRPGPVLVVGAGHSGGDVAFEAGSAGHPTVLSGRIHGEIPFDIEGRSAHVLFPVLFFLATHVFTIRTPIGRKMRPQVRAHGGPLIRVKRSDLERVGVELAGERTIGTRDGRPVLADGRVLDVTNIVWCTGFRQDFSWIDLPVVDESGWPHERRGVAETYPGLYFVGLAFQYAFVSMLIGGVGRDAGYVAKHIASRTSKRTTRTPIPA
ncbi:putative flavoprotein involved in K+ transport [Halopolyspora algeriensis]|uniref:Putative flavoprotein involved in K+ transport n=1 Tax=Halopolyspora algeriensis TaxID=1500506 RepID=A0A368VNP6_9ACTN|nr:FAD-dependent oxidoreductase [Halopolyspora algeriensis]RCW40733.1 putative flavoprotein involved in K+ transport [Halopolyspora algeriensis]TQM53348.1 putative flavoprotein involved in K+ transport [Halopolyspora algeriensis]